jgi:metal-responsive CopG/Arc/MetJ family transcriptional regulator
MKKTPGKRITLSLYPEQMRYLEQYQKEHGLSSRSAVVEAAFKALRERELEE